MPPSASMPLTVAALSGSSPASGVPYYPQQQHQMMHQQHMMMMQQQQQMQHHQQLQQQQYQQQQPLPPSKLPASAIDPTASITTGIQCDFCGGDEQENKTTKLPEQMITCKVISIDCYSSTFKFHLFYLFRIVVVLRIQHVLNLLLTWFVRLKPIHGNVWNVKHVQNVEIQKMIPNFYFVMIVIGN
jgi:hypothetical protein